LLFPSGVPPLDELCFKWFCAMRQADFATAWQISDAILNARTPGEHCWHLPRHEQWVWDGRPFTGQRVLVRCYHGLGDTLQFARFLAPLSQMAKTTTVWAQPALIPVLRRLKDAQRLIFIPLHAGNPDVDYDVDIEIMELAHALRVTEADLTRSVPYFDVPRAPRSSSTRAVGIALKTGGWDDRRTLPFELIDRLQEHRCVELVNLQLDPPLPDIRDLSTPDVECLAERLGALDLVITPDTMLAHLAGALNVPTWTLLPADADWRWLQPDRTDSPWYPRMRLFRQPRPGDWASVVNAVQAELERTLLPG
jgi:hypothetical protein